MCRFKPVIFSVLLGAGSMLALGQSVHASEAPGHFKGVPSETLEQAVTNFSEYNNKLEAVLAGELDAKALYEIHQLTYTLEIALEKINDEMKELAEVLEELHVATEKNDAATARDKGAQYLEISRKVIK